MSNQYARLRAELDAGDCGQEVGYAGTVMHGLRQLYGARDVSQTRHRFLRFYDRATARPIPELQPVALAIGAWQEEFLACFTTGRALNGPTEAVKLIIKDIKGVSFGFRNFANYRLGVLPHAGIWWTVLVTPPMRPRNTPCRAS